MSFLPPCAECAVEMFSAVYFDYSHISTFILYIYIFVVFFCNLVSFRRGDSKRESFNGKRLCGFSQMSSCTRCMYSKWIDAMHAVGVVEKFVWIMAVRKWVLGRYEKIGLRRGGYENVLLKLTVVKPFRRKGWFKCIMEPENRKKLGWNENSKYPLDKGCNKVYDSVFTKS